MKKLRVTIGVIFCLFILCSITYQPTIAYNSTNDEIENNINLKTKQSDKINIGTIVGLLNSLKNKKDCGCDDESKGLWPFPILCSILMIPYIIFTIGWFIFKLDIFRIINTIIYTIADILGCPWV